MPGVCPQCGAMLNEAASCQEIFDSFLVLEYTDPDYGAVHFLTVACFLIQHGHYSDEGLAWICRMLQAYLEGGLTDGQLRKLAAKDTDNRTRTWKVNRAASDPPQPKVKWTMTIADVAANSQDAKGYCESVKKWARITVDEMKPLLAGSSRFY